MSRQKSDAENRRPDHDRAAGDQQGADRDHAADAVVERQAVVHAVAGLGVEQAGEPLAPSHDAVMADLGPPWASPVVPEV